MNATDRLRGRTRYVAVLIALLVMAAAATVLALVYSEPAVAVWVFAFSLAFVVLTMAIVKLLSDTRRLASVASQLEADTTAISDRVHSLEEKAQSQDALNEALLDRVGATERAARSQEGFNEAVLDRVRVTERAARSQEGFNEGVLDRVRVTERAARSQEGFNEAILDRVRALESGPVQRGRFPGTDRRLGVARKMISTATDELEHSARLDSVQRSTRAEEPERQIDVDAATATDPAVTVIVTCYNEERFIGEALASIKQQSFTRWECIVVDDASTDGSVAEIEQFVSSDRRFRLVAHEVNRDVSVARNTGLQLATGRYVAFLDADDLLMVDSLADRFEALEAATDPHIAGVFCGVRPVDEGVQLSELPSSMAWPARPRFRDFVTAEGECPFTLNAPLLRTDVVRSCGGFNESMTTAEDWDLWLRLMRNGFYFVPSHAVTAVYRQKTASKIQAGALDHVKAANHLIASTCSEAETSCGVPIAYPFPRARSHYEVILVRTRRAILYASTALLRGELDVFDSTINTLDQGSWPFVRRHLDIERLATDGFRRAAGLDVNEAAKLASELEPLRRFVFAAVGAATR